MAKVVLVKPLFPYPPTQGTRRVSLALLEDLASEHEVVYLCQRESVAEAEHIGRIEALGARVLAPLMPNHRSLAHKVCYKVQNLVQSRRTGVPALCYYWSNRALRAGLRELMDRFRPDLTILENWETYRLRDSITRGIPALLAHDAAFQIRERAARAAEGTPRHAALAAAARRYKALEVAAWARFPNILCLTQDDEATIRTELAAHRRQAARESAPGRAARGAPGSASPREPRVQHLEVPVPGELFAAGRPAKPGLRVGFMGSFRADFNQDALAFILEEIWPRVKQAQPRAELHIAGNGYDGALKSRAVEAGARWLGFVENLADYFAGLDLLIVPLRFGGGVRIRILEALAAAVPVVATPVAVAGLPLEAGVHVAVADGGDALARAITALLAEPERARALGQAGRDWCFDRHSPGVLRPRRLATVRRILEEGGAP